MIPALILTAGLATRLRPLSFVRAKGALPVGRDAIAARILRTLAGAGVTDAVLNLHHLPHTLTREIGDGSALGLRVRYSWEVPLLGSAGGPKRALPIAGNDTLLVVNGDTLTDADIAAVVHAHEDSDALVTMAVIPNHEPEKYGGVLVDEAGRVRGFCRRGSTERSFHFIGVQVLEARALASVPGGVPYESVGSLYPALIAERFGAVRVYHCDAEFLDIGTPADYLATALRIAGREEHDPAAGADVAADARVERSVLWRDVRVERGAWLKECVVTDEVVVPADTAWHCVTLRRATGDLAPGEKQVGDLAVCSL